MEYSIPIIGEQDIDFETFMLEDGRVIYAIVVDGQPILGFDVYGAQELIDAIEDCVRELQRIESGEEYD